MKIRYVLLDGIAYAQVKDHARLLPRERQEKIERLRFDRDKLLSLTAGLLIRDAAGGAPLKTTDRGKPYAVGSDKHFSVSHSGDCAAIAVDDSEIGVDVERLPQKDHTKLAERFFHPNERAYVMQSKDQARAFARIWTRKEAYLKQIGIGVATDLSAFDTMSGALNDRIASFDIGEYVLSVCAENPITKTADISLKELKDLLDQ